MKSTDSLDQVRRAAGKGAAVSPWMEGELPGVELFSVTTKTDSGKNNERGVAVIGGKLPWLEGEAAMAAIAKAGISDAIPLAQAASFLLLARGQLIEKPADWKGTISPAQRAALTEPKKTADALELCYFAGRSGLRKARVELATWKATSTPLEAVVQAGQDPFELATAALADSSEARNKIGVDQLVALCSDARAPELLLNATRSHPKAATRALAAGGLATCKHKASATALAGALAKESDVSVRKALVQALGTLAEPATRPVLQAVARDDKDAEVRSYAEWALGKLPKAS